MFLLSTTSSGTKLRCESLSPVAEAPASSAPVEVDVDVAPLVAGGNYVTALAASLPGGRVALCGTAKGTVVCWAADPTHSLRVCGALRAHAYQVRRLRFSLMGDRAVSCSDDCTCVVFDVAAAFIAASGDIEGSPESHTRRLHGHRTAVTDARFSADATRVASCSCDGTVLLHRCTDGQVQRRFPVGHPLVALVLSVDETLIFTATREAVFRVDTAALFRPAVERRCTTSTQAAFCSAPSVDAASAAYAVVQLPIGSGEAAPPEGFAHLLLAAGGTQVVALSAIGATVSWSVSPAIVDDGTSGNDDSSLLRAATATLVSSPLLPVLPGDGAGVPSLGWASWHAPAIAVPSAGDGSLVGRVVLGALLGADASSAGETIASDAAEGDALTAQSVKRTRPADAATVRLEELLQKQRRLQAVCDELYAKLQEANAADQ